MADKDSKGTTIEVVRRTTLEYVRAKKSGFVAHNHEADQFRTESDCVLYWCFSRAARPSIRANFAVTKLTCYRNPWHRLCFELGEESGRTPWPGQVKTKRFWRIEIPHSRTMASLLTKVSDEAVVIASLTCMKEAQYTSHMDRIHEPE